MFWPTNLAFFYPYPVQNASIFYAVISAIFLLAVTIFVLRFAKSHRYLFTGWFWYLGTLVPVIGLVQVGEQAMADRYSYISLTGLFIIIAWGLAELRNKKAALVLSVLIISAMSICTSFELRYWRNSLSLFQRALDVTKNNYMAHFCIAEPLLAANGPDEAIYHYRSALQIKPTYIKARIGLAIVLLSLGRDNEAVKCLDEALRIKPDSAEAHANMGRALARQGNTDRAIQHFEEALRLEPDWIDPMNSLAWLLATSGKTAAGNPGKAIKLALRACELTDYNSPELLDTLAVSYAAAGDFGKAIETTEKAIELCQSGKQETLKKEIESRVVLFKAGKPYIETK